MNYNLLLDSDLLRYANIGLTEDDAVTKERVANITESEICEVSEIFNTEKTACDIDDRRQVEIN